MVMFQTKNTKNCWQSYIFQCNTIHFLSLLVRPRRCEFQRLRLLNFGTASEFLGSAAEKVSPDEKLPTVCSCIKQFWWKINGFDRFVSLPYLPCLVFAVVSGAKNLAGLFLGEPACKHAIWTVIMIWPQKSRIIQDIQMGLSWFVGKWATPLPRIVNWHNYGKSQFVIGKSSINGDFPLRFLMVIFVYLPKIYTDVFIILGYP